jgi:YesN/AraC family two-component response regulator
VLEACDGVEALALSENHRGPIHLLLTDVVMPRLGGGRLARRMNRQRPDTRVLFMSGFADSTLVRHEVVNGDIDCLLKPFTPEGLARKVRETLDNAMTDAPI